VSRYNTRNTNLKQIILRYNITLLIVMYSPITQQAWKAVLSWFGFFYQIFSQIIGSFADNYPLLSLSSNSSFESLSTLDNESSVQIIEDADHQPPQKLTVCMIIFFFHCFLFIGYGSKLVFLLINKKNK